MSEKIAKFRFIGCKILESSFSLNENITSSPKLHVDFEHTSHEENSKNQYKYIITVRIEDENETIKIRLKAMGIFEFDEDLTNKQLFFSQNAPAILFPYIRAYISALTALSGIPTITLPTLNLSKSN